MLYVALVEAAALVALVSTFSRILRSTLREGSRRENALLDRVLHVSGNPWNVAPADEFVPPARSPYDDDGEMILSQHYSRFTSTPEQEP